MQQVRVDSLMFAEFLRAVPQRFVHRRIVVLDKAPFHLLGRAFRGGSFAEQHRNSEAAVLLRQRGVLDVMFTPTATPQLNPIESAFNTMKHYTRKRLARQRRASRLHISLAVDRAAHREMLSREKVERYVACSGYSLGPQQPVQARPLAEARNCVGEGAEEGDVEVHVPDHRNELGKGLTEGDPMKLAGSVQAARRAFRAQPCPQPAARAEAPEFENASGWSRTAQNNAQGEQQQEREQERERVRRRLRPRNLVVVRKPRAKVQ